jgi:hypothetical protein
MKKFTILATVFFVLLFSSFLEVKGQSNFPSSMPQCMLTNNLQISTGYDYENNVWYNANERDEYWSLISAQGIATPFCAFVWGQWSLGGSNWGALTNCRAISAVPNGAQAPVNATAVGCSLKATAVPYTFRRRFYSTVAMQATLNLLTVWDDQINQIRFNGVNTGIPPTTCTTSTLNTAITINLIAGENIIDIDIFNRQLGNGGLSPMELKVEAFVVTPVTAKVLVLNDYYGKNTTAMNWNYCAPPYGVYSSPVITGDPCIAAGTTNTYTFTNFNDAVYDYYVNGTLLTTNSFQASGGMTYTLEVKKNGCVLETKSVSTVTPGTTPLFMTTNRNCFGPLSSYPYPQNSAILTYNATGVPPYTYAIQLPNGSFVYTNSNTNNPLTYTTSVPGNYTVRLLKDGCLSTSSASVYIGKCEDCNVGIIPPNTNNYPPVYGSQFPSPPLNTPWYGDNKTSTLFPTGTAPTSPMIIAGTLTVDNNWNILNNQNVFFAKDAKIVLKGSNKTFTVNNSTLQGCYWWQGILADTLTQTVNIQNSNIENMSCTFIPNTGWGVRGLMLKNGANCFIKNNRFTNNYFSSITLQDYLGTYNGVIEGNTFRGPLGVFNYNIAHTRWGIIIHNMADVTIGNMNSVEQGNKFIKMQRGILAHNFTNSFGQAPKYSTIKLYNNQFDSIRYASLTTSSYINNIPYLSYEDNYKNVISQYSSSYNYDNNGTAIVGIGAPNSYQIAGTNNTVWLPSTMKLIVDCLPYGENANVVIKNADVGIATLNCDLDVQNYHFENTLIGIRTMAQCKTNYDIRNTTMDAPHFGIQLNGNIGMMNIRSNNINLRDQAVNIPKFLNYPLYNSPIGIDLKFINYTPSANGSIDKFVYQNVINIAYKTGIGIQNLNGKSDEEIDDNFIQFNGSSTGNTNNHVTRALYGIYNSNCNGTIMNANAIRGYGLMNKNVFMARNAIGIYLDQSPKCWLGCNSVNHARYGIYAWGNCTTSPERVSNNKMDANNFPWYFLDAGSASPATFGNIGDPAQYDNGNEFVGSNNWMGINNLNPNLYKVFRNSSSSSQDVIYTDPALLDVNESGSNIPANKYEVQNNFMGYTDPCGPQYNKPANETTIAPELIEDAEAIAEDSVSYLSYPDVGDWIDKMNLYEQLDQDSLLRNSSTELYNYYTQQSGSMIDKIHRANLAIDLLGSETTDTNNIASRYNSAVQLNNDIVNGEQWEMNEKLVNDVQLALFTTEPDSIDADSKNFILALANTCPFVGGKAVYKARVLASNWDGAGFYDDRILCMPATANKGGNGNNNEDIDIDAYYENELKNNRYADGSPIVKPVIKQLMDGEVSIYPNPAKGFANISYRCATDGECIVYNQLGQEVVKIDLPTDKNNVDLSIENLAKGVYTYKCKFKNCNDYIGKLVVE